MPRERHLPAQALGLSSIDGVFVPWDKSPEMRTTLALDDELVAKAQAFTGLKEKSALSETRLKCPAMSL
jgi:hypothetical protein